MRGARRRPALLLAVQLAALLTGSVQQRALQSVPFPDLDGLEPVVAAQIAALQASLATALEAPRATDEGLGIAFGDLGRTYHAYEFFDAAAACYSNARSLFPEDFRWPYYLGSLQRAAGALDAAVPRYEEALLMRPGYVPALVAIGEIHVEQNNMQEAERFLTRALEIAPTSAAAMAALGEISLSRRDFATAIQQLEVALTWAPAANRLHYPLALAYRGLGDRVAAERNMLLRGSVGVRVADPLFEDITELQRGEAVHLLRGRRAFAAERYEDAVQAFQSAAEAAPRSARVRVNLSAALAALGDNESAIVELEAALSLDPDNATAHFNLASLLMLAENTDAAAEHLAATVRLDPADGQAALALARIRAQQGRHDQTLALLESAVAAGTNSGATQALSRYLASCAAPCERNGGRALELAIADFQDIRSALHAETVALAFAALGRCSEATRWQRTAVQSSAENEPIGRRQAREAALLRYAAGPPCAATELVSWQ